MPDTEINELDAFLLDALDEEIPGFKVPNVAEMTDEFIIDKLGVLKDRRKRLEKFEKLLVAAIKGRDLKTGAKGNRFELVRDAVPTTRFDQGKAKEFLTDEQIGECMNSYDQDKVVIKAL